MVPARFSDEAHEVSVAQHSNDFTRASALPSQMVVHEGLQNFLEAPQAMQLRDAELFFPPLPPYRLVTLVVGPTPEDKVQEFECNATVATEIKDVEE